MAVEQPSGLVARVALLSADELAGCIVATDLATHRDHRDYSGRRYGVARGRCAVSGWAAATLRAEGLGPGAD